MNAQAPSFDPSFPSKECRTGDDTTATTSLFQPFAFEPCRSLPRTSILKPSAAPFEPVGSSVSKEFVPGRATAMDVAAPSFEPSARLQQSTSTAEPSKPRLNEDLQPNATAFVPKEPLVCRFYLRGICTKGLACPFSHKAPETTAEDAKANSESASVMEYRVEEGITCCFGPGVSIVRLDLGKDVSNSTTITISSLPKTVVGERDIEARLSPFGTLTSLSLHHDTGAATQYAVATFDTKSCAERAVAALHGSPVSSWIGVVVPGRRMLKTEKRQDQSVLVAFKSRTKSSEGLSVKVQWYAPSRCAWLQYEHAWQASRAAKTLQGKTIDGRVVTASFKPLPKQHAFHRQRLRPSLQSVWIGNLSSETAETSLKHAVRQITKLPILSVNLSDPPFSEQTAPSVIQKLLRRFGPIASFESQKAEKGQSKRKALVRFIKRVDAENAHAHFQRARIEELGGGKLYLQPIYSFKHTLPRHVFKSLRPLLDSKLSAKSTGMIRTKFVENQHGTSVTMLVTGDVPETIDQLSATLRPIMDGEAVRDPKNGNILVWNRQLLRSKQLQDIYIKMGCPGSSAVWIDIRRQELRVFGSDTARRQLKQAILEHLESSTVQLSIVNISREQYDSILLTGRDILDKLSRATGAKKVSLDVKKKALLFEGDLKDASKAQAVIKKVMAKREEADEGDDAPCPVCFCTPDNPTVELSCGHSLCHDCFVSWLSNCSSSDFPVLCLAEGCKTPLDLRCLKKYLASEMLNRVFSLAVDDHVRKNYESLQFCVSPTCPGIYLVSPEGVDGICSTCQVSICLKCKVSHSNMTCSDYRLASQPPDALRMQVVDEILTLQCPRCHQAFLDFSGCFALRCSSCPCAFCGWCLQDCGSDAHAHVMNACTAKPPGHRDYFGTFDQFQTAQKENRRKRLLAFLSKLTPSNREKCVASLERDLSDLAIRI